MALVVGGPEQLGALPEGDALGRLRSRYRLVVGRPDGRELEPPGEVEAVTLPGRLYDHLPLPAAAMIDPEGVVQGIGSIADSSELLAFVHEGEHHGFGPSTPLRDATQIMG